MAVQKTMQLLAAKLDLGENEKVVSKAAELERLLLNKTVAGSSITDTAKAVICLDLASSLCGVDVNVKMAIKYSGLKAPSYLNNRKMVENLLELNTERLTVPALCLTLQCSGVQAAAEDILREYQAKSKMELDLDLPQYVCMAVYQACRLNKVKVLKSKVIEKSRIKPGQWTKMDSDWTKFVDEHFASVAKKKRGRPPKNVTVEDAPNEEQMDVACNENKDGPQLIEPYNDWKQRILEIAYKELEELSRLESKTESLHSPRRSPRKTPQKFSPYKNCPNTSKGVRLLFPL
ncbi:unnamed protein product [Plutella xylostella]|uniref:(diamondback moth) hypothetical protein n=1 Tax=Plutella xylostella TaxID=51655 RepID=A0A8S4F7M6_PLUXY|nr:unnamed protein product [Plutella xylostella]